MRSRAPFAGLVALALTTVSLTILAPAADADPNCSQAGLIVTCSFPGGVSAWTVPSNIAPNSVAVIDARGQAGEGGTYYYPNGLPSSGGRGADVQAGFVLAPGTQLTVTVPSGNPLTNFGGGGSGVHYLGDHVAQSGSGGGFAGVSFTNSPGGLVVAGGGGGGGMGGALDPDGLIPTALRGGYGGDAGLPGSAGATAATGDANTPLSGGHGGYGGGAAGTGGAAGPGGNGTIAGGGGFPDGCDDGTFTPGVDGLPGSPGQGGSAQSTAAENIPAGGGGGGGFGGGGSGGGGAHITCTFPIITAAGGGGGGSSYVNPTAAAGSVAASLIDGSVATDGGAVTIAYTITPPDVTAPTVAIDPVASPRTTAVPSIQFQYSEPVSATPAYTLTRNGTVIPDLPVIGIEQDLAGHFVGFTFDTSGVTTAAGVYVFTVSAAGITDLAGNPAAADASITWTNTSVTGTFGAVASPRASGVDSIPLTFDTAVTGVDIGDFRIFRDGVATPLTGVSVSGSGANYSLDGLGALTAPEGVAVAWELELRGPSDTGIVNAYGTGAPETSVAFTVEAAAAPTASFTAVDTPRSTALDAAQLTFSEPVFAVDITDFSLTRNGTPVDLSAASVTGHGADYTISGLSALTAPGDASADYTLTLHDSGTNITNDEGVDLASGASLDFTVQAKPTLARAAVTSVSPRSGPSTGGQTVIITGSNFTGASRVVFDGTSATSFTVDSDTQITAVAPPHAAKVVRVRVRTAGLSAKTPASRYTYVKG